MALPLIPFIIKVIILKIFKGALVGIFRYLPQINKQGDSLNGMDHINQVVNKEWKKKDNMIFLILMLSSALYGLQEIIVWLWIKFAKWRFKAFFTFTPAALESPDDFIERVHTFSWLKISYEVLKWVFIASLIYWPKTSNTLKIHPEDNKNWVSIIRERKIFLIRVDEEREFTYRDMHISITSRGDIQIKTFSGLIAIYTSDDV